LLTLAILFSIAQFALSRSEISNRGEIELVLRRRNDERRQVAELSAALQLSDSRHEAYKVIEAYAQRILPEVAGAFYVYTASRDQLTLVAQWSARALAPAEADRPAALGFVDHLHPGDCWGLRQGGRHTGSTENGEPLDSDTAPLSCRHIEPGVGTYMCIPIVGRGQILGMLHLRGAVLGSARTSEHISPSIERLADQLSLSLTNLDLRERLENMALRDGLTGLYNRRFLDEMLEHELAKLRRSGKRAGVMLIDVDHFKRFNDTYGHQAGDEALRKVGAALLANVRASDVVCRYGGEEFLVFLPECDLAECTARAEALRAAVFAITLRVAGNTIPSISASFGLAIFPDVTGNRTDLIQLADRALYRAKGEGRNRVAVAEAPAPPTAQAAK
jgi:diguanylate cyclase (GGDEF)-like protein